MTRPIPAIWLLLASTFGLFALACEPGGVGDPCIPEDEYQPGFGGYDVREVNVESRSFQCETRVCLVNHFQGRVSCPYGQSEADLSLPAADKKKRCRIPGTSGLDEADGIKVAVKPQAVSRQGNAYEARTGGKDAVYCSCRCANAKGSTDDGARYCECPSGYQCAKLIDDLGLGKEALAGSYCIKKGTAYPPTTIPEEECASDFANCGNNGENF